MAKKPRTKRPAQDPPERPDGEALKESLTLREYLDTLAQDDLEAAPEPEEKSQRWVSFILGEERFGLSVDKVREVLRVGTITHVPRAPKALRGVTNLRGRVLAVVDLRVRLGMEKADIAETSRVLVAVGPSGPVGLLVDQVEQMEQILPSTVQEPPDRLATVASFSPGVVSKDDKLLVLLDLEPLLQEAAPS